MKILLTHGYFLQEDEKEQQIMRPYPPLGLLYISAYLIQHHYPNEIFDSTFSNFQNLKKHLQEEQPQIVAIYTNLMTKLNVLKIIETIRSNQALEHTKIILGGPEVTYHAENFLRYGADVIIYGEGEQTMLEVVTFVDMGEGSLNQIKGISFIDEEGQFQQNPQREKIKDVDSLPFPNRQGINLNLYIDCWKKFHGKSTININTMRGCPYTCKWCSRAVYGQSYRRRSPKLVVDELEWLLRNYEVDTFWFVDDVFTVSHKWLEEFVQEVKQRQLKFEYECITRADRMNEQVVQLLKESGCFRVWIGAESGSQKILDAMDRRVTVEQVRDMIQLSKSYGLKAGTFIMLGYPGETEKDIKKTLNHLKSSDPDEYTITVAYPIKGTPLYTEVEDILLNPLPWEQTNDRQNDFPRVYKHQYYNYAIRWIYNEVAASKSKKPINRLMHKGKALAARAGMKFYL